MNIKNCIKGIENYYRQFNSTPEVSYLGVVFPEDWRVPELDDFEEVQAEEDEGTYYFYTESEDVDCLFEAVRYVIRFNEELAERLEIFKEKQMELNTICSVEPIEKLKKLTFSFTGGRRNVPTIKEIKETKAEKKTTKKATKSKAAPKPVALPVPETKAPSMMEDVEALIEGEENV